MIKFAPHKAGFRSSLAIAVAFAGLSGCSSTKDGASSFGDASPSMLMQSATAQAWNDSLKQITDAINANPHKPILYSFGANNQIPIQEVIPIKSQKNNNGTLLLISKRELLNKNAVLLIIPDASDHARAMLLGDTNSAVDGTNRCELNSDAQTTDGLHQNAELYTPTEAFSRLKQPDFMTNANYFDVRPQKNGQTWKSTNCSIPLGMYFDNDITGPTGGTHSGTTSPARYFPGPKHYIWGKTGDIATVDTAFFSRNFYDYMEVAVNDINSSQSINLADRFYRETPSRTFVAVSGTSLFSRNSDIQPDEGEKQTTRVAIGYDRWNHRLYVFEGGDYKTGVSREQIAGLFMSLGVHGTALELDGGGSAALVVKDSFTTAVGGTRPPTSCPGIGAWCSPVTQPDGKPRPVPSWLGFRYGLQ